MKGEDDSLCSSENKAGSLVKWGTLPGRAAVQDCYTGAVELLLGTEIVMGGGNVLYLKLCYGIPWPHVAIEYLTCDSVAEGLNSHFYLILSKMTTRGQGLPSGEARSRVCSLMESEIVRSGRSFYLKYKFSC